MHSLSASAVVVRRMHGKGSDRTDITLYGGRTNKTNVATQVNAWIEHKGDKTPLCAKHYKTFYKAFTAPIPHVSFVRRPTGEQRFTRKCTKQEFIAVQFQF